MAYEHVPLAKQVGIVFQEIRGELSQLTSGIVFIQIRNNSIGKFGARHFPIESKGGVLQPKGEGLNEAHLSSFRRLAVESLRHKMNWTHGEISFEFALKQDVLFVSVQLESNYNMANLTHSSKQMREIY